MIVISISDPYTSLTPAYKCVTFFIEVIKMKKPDPIKAKKHLDKIRQLVGMRKSPFSHMNEEEVIKEIRKTREKLWEEKLAGHRS